MSTATTPYATRLCSQNIGQAVSGNISQGTQERTAAKSVRIYYVQIFGKTGYSEVKYCTQQTIFLPL